MHLWLIPSHTEDPLRRLLTIIILIIRACLIHQSRSSKPPLTGQARSITPEPLLMQGQLQGHVCLGGQLNAVALEPQRKRYEAPTSTSDP